MISRIKQTTKIFLGLIFFAMTMVLIPFYMYYSHDVTKLIDHYPHIQIKGDEADYVIKPTVPKGWVRLANMSKPLKWAIIFSEDWAFYSHSGLDLEQVKVALTQMLEENKFRGASTITQQMIKNVYLSHERSLWRKIHEMILTFRVEKHLHKQRILEIYLNIIEFGPGIYGIKNACSHYFNKAPSQITPREAAFLAMLLPGPKLYYISFKKKQLTSFAHKRINAILRKLKMGKVITPNELNRELSSRFSWEKNIAYKKEESVDLTEENAEESLSLESAVEMGEVSHEDDDKVPLLEEVSDEVP